MLDKKKIAKINKCGRVSKKERQKFTLNAWQSLKIIFYHSQQRLYDWIIMFKNGSKWVFIDEIFSHPFIGEANQFMKLRKFAKRLFITVYKSIITKWKYILEIQLDFVHVCTHIHYHTIQGGAEKFWGWSIFLKSDQMTKHFFIFIKIFVVKRAFII